MINLEQIIFILMLIIILGLFCFLFYNDYINPENTGENFMNETGKSWEKLEKEFLGEK